MTFHLVSYTCENGGNILKIVEKIWLNYARTSILRSGSL